MEIWYMVFDIPPHNNREVSLYFLWRLYAEFMMGKHVNYFDTLGFQGIGREIPQNWPNARHKDPNQLIPPPHLQLPMLDIPPAHDMVTQTQEAFLTLAEMVSRHSTTINHAGPSSSSGVQPPASNGRVPSIGGDRPTSHVPQSDPYRSTMCGQILLWSWTNTWYLYND